MNTLQSRGARFVFMGLLCAWQCALTGEAFAQCQVDQLTGLDGVTTDQFGKDVAISGDTAVCGVDFEFTDQGAIYIHRWVNEQWVCTQRIFCPGGQIEPLFGSAVDVRGDLMAIGSRNWDNGMGGDPGAFYVFEKNIEGDWTQAQRLLAADGASGDGFGCAINIGGGRIIVGARGDDDNGRNSGSAYIFEHTKHKGRGWVQRAKLVAPDGAMNDAFGRAVAINDSIAVVGAPNNDVGGTFGSVYVYRRDGLDWNFEAKLRASDALGADDFGESIDIDGDTLIIGAWGYDDQTGKAYIFTYDGAQWNEETILAASDGEPFDSFGIDVAIQGDRVVVGARGADGDANNDGAVYIFQANGGAWEEAAILQPVNPEIDDWFGGCLDLHDAQLIVGGWTMEPDPQRAFIFDFAGPDCNDNGQCDGRDISTGASIDCNDNAVPDECDLAPAPFTAVSTELGPIGADTPQAFVIASAPYAQDDVALSVTAHADLESHLEYINIKINGYFAGPVFVNGYEDCEDPPSVDELLLPANVFNNMIADSDEIVIDLLPTNGVSSGGCSGESMIQAAITYTGAVSLDRNANNVPDECEQLPACPWDTAPAAGDDMVSLTDLNAILTHWGSCPAPPSLCPWDFAPEGGDGMVGLGDLHALLSNWGPCG